MTATLTELGGIIIALLAFGIFFLPPGYLAGLLLNVFHMRRRSLAEQGLWSLVLSAPLSLLLVGGLGRFWSATAVLVAFGIIALSAIAIWGIRLRQTRPPAPKGVRLAILAALAAVVYTTLATMTIVIGTRLFAPTVMMDWAVRLPLIASAAHHGLPPPNPLSALGGRPAALRYYYFWYVLCAEPVRLLHLPAQVVMSASAGWAALSILAAAILALRYLAGERDFGTRRVALLLLSFGVIGLDVIYFLMQSPKSQPQIHVDLEWWRRDRTPGILTSILYSPHHMVGLACCITAMLLLVESRGPDARAGESVEPGYQGLSTPMLAARALLVGFILAACAGTSTFLTFIFGGVCVVWGLDLLRTRAWRGLAVLLGSGVFAWILNHPYLRELSTGTSAAHGFATISERNGEGAEGFFTAHHLLSHHRAAAAALRQVYILLFDFVELGFFFFVLLDRLRRELLPALRQGSVLLTPGQRGLWMLLAGAGLNALLVSSRVTQSDNDLGMHAAMLVRLVLMIWSVSFLERNWFSQAALPRVPRCERSLRWAAGACLVIGLVGGVANVLLERFYFPLKEAYLLREPDFELVSNRLSYRLYDIRSVSRWMDLHLPADARIQFNPSGILQPADSFFSRRQIVASDLGCGTAFGGDYAACAPVVSDLWQIYGGFPAKERLEANDHVAVSPRPADVTTTAVFEHLCGKDGLQFVLADDTDPAWSERNSWVWSTPVLFANASIRVFRCSAR